MLLHTIREKRITVRREVRRDIAAGAYDFYFADPSYKTALLVAEAIW